MTLVDFDKLVVPTSVDSWRSTIFTLLASADFPTTSWSDTSEPRGLIELEALTLAELSTVVSDIAKGGFLDYAEADWLALLAKSVFDVDKKPSVTAVGVERLTNATANPITVGVGQWFATSNGVRFVSTSGGTIPASPGTLDVTIQAEGPGADWNVGNNTITSMLTPIPGVTVSNPAIGSTGIWRTTEGTDEESDPALRLRCRARWGALGAGANDDAYFFWATTASNQVTRVRVIEDTPDLGHVTVVVAGQSGAITSSPELSAIDAYIQERRPLCVVVHTLSATNRVISLEGAIACKAAFQSSVVSAIGPALQAFFASIPIGGVVEIVDLVTTIRNIPGVVNVGLTLPSSSTTYRLVTDDIALGSLEVATFTNALSFPPV